MCLIPNTTNAFVFVSLGTTNAHVFGESDSIRVSVWDGTVKQTRMCGKCVCFVFVCVWYSENTAPDAHVFGKWITNAMYFDCVWMCLPYQMLQTHTCMVMHKTNAHVFGK